MKSLVRLGSYPAVLPIVADDVLEFHAARLLLLLKLCGQKNAIEGLTKMAKLDFFVRYPDFFNVACKELGVERKHEYIGVESHMVRFHYGPWDRRYYHVLSYLESRGLISATRSKTTYILSLTALGDDLSQAISEAPEFESISAHMINVKRVLGGLSGSRLKDLIYQLFDEQVGQLPLQQVIE